MSDAAKLSAKACDIILSRYAEDPRFEGAPTVYAVRDDVVLGALELDFANETVKHASIEAARSLVHGIGCDATVFTSEAWMAIRDVDPRAADITEQVLGVRPSKDPQRVEILLVEVSTKGHYIMTIYKMLRDEAGLLTKLEVYQRYDSKEPGPISRSKFDFFEGIPTETLQ